MKYIHMPRLEYYKPFFSYIYTSKKSMIQQTIFSLSYGHENEVYNIR